MKPTFILLTESLIDRAREEQKTACGPLAAREFALTITALEDAAMRFNQDIALKNGLNHSLLGEDAEAVIEVEQAEAIAEAPDVPGDAGVYPGQMDVDEVLAAGESYGPAAV